MPKRRSSTLETRDGGRQSWQSRRVRFDFSDEFAVLVGECDKRYTVHTGVITRLSAFFRMACSSDEFKEADDKAISLPDIDPEIFPIYLQWAYSGSLYLLREGQAEDDYRGRCELLTRIYVLADVLDDMLLRNTVIDAIRDTFEVRRKGMNIRALELAWEYTAEGSTLRRLFIDWHLMCCKSKFLRFAAEYLPKAFYVDLVVAFSEVGRNKDLVRDYKTAPACEYHEHDESLPPCDQSPFHDDQEGMLLEQEDTGSISAPEEEEPGEILFPTPPMPPESEDGHGHQDQRRPSTRPKTALARLLCSRVSVDSEIGGRR